jgi:hypothetical protein
VLHEKASTHCSVHTVSFQKGEQGAVNGVINDKMNYELKNKKVK